MSDITAVLTALREELVAAGLGRHPADAGAAPPIWVENDELPAPGQAPDGTVDDATLVVGLRHSGDLADESNFVTWRRVVIDVSYRSLTNAGLKRAYALDAAIRARLIRPATNYGYGFELGTAAAIFVQQVSLYGGIGPVSREPLHNNTLFDDQAKWVLEVPA